MLDFVMADPDRTERFLDQVLALAKAYALAGARDEAAAIRNDARLFADVRAAILKIQNPDSGRGGSGAVEIDTAIGQLVNEAVTADEVVDIYKLAGVETPELSILSDEFLDSLAHKDKPNLQMGLLRRLLNDQIKTIQRTNLVQARKFSEQLEEAINRYTNRIADDRRDHRRAGQAGQGDARRPEAPRSSSGCARPRPPSMTPIVQNDAAVLQMGDDTLKKIAHELVTAVRSERDASTGISRSPSGRPCGRRSAACSPSTTTRRPRREGGRTRAGAGRAVRGQRGRRCVTAQGNPHSGAMVVHRHGWIHSRGTEIRRSLLCLQRRVGQRTRE